MRSRWLSTFTLIGLLLIGLGIVGLVLGQHFVFDPGQISDGKQPWYYEPSFYIAIGVLMALNGLLTPLPVSEKARETPNAKTPSGTAARGKSRDAVATTVETSSE